MLALYIELADWSLIVTLPSGLSEGAKIQSSPDSEWSVKFVRTTDTESVGGECKPRRRNQLTPPVREIPGAQSGVLSRGKTFPGTAASLMEFHCAGKRFSLLRSAGLCMLIGLLSPATHKRHLSGFTH